MRHKSTELMGTIKAFVEEYYKNYRHGCNCRRGIINL